MRLYDDWRSAIHTAAAATSVILGIEIAVTICFIIYEGAEDRWRSLEDIIEFVIGLFIGGAVKILLHVHNIIW